MSKDTYRALCHTVESIPLFSRDWWLDAACGEAYWDAFLVEAKSGIRAAWPFYRPRPRMITLPPYTQTMGIWFAPPSDDTKYASALESRHLHCKQLLARMKPNRSFLQNFHYTFTDWLPFYWEGYQQTTRYTYLISDLTNPDRLWENMSQNIRRNIRKAQEQGITVRKGLAVDEFLHLQAQTFERQSAKIPLHAHVLRRLIDASRHRGQGELWGGYDAQGRLHAVAFVVWQKTAAYYIAGGGDPAFRFSGAHSLVLWDAIRFAATQADTFDFEGSMLPGVERFFREFGGIQTPYFAISKGKPSWWDRGLIKLRNL
jgi:hypothetical protein